MANETRSTLFDNKDNKGHRSTTSLMNFNEPKIKLYQKLTKPKKVVDELPTVIRSKSLLKSNSIQTLSSSLTSIHNLQGAKKINASKLVLKELFNNDFITDNELTITNEIASLRTKHINTLNTINTFEGYK